MIAALPPLPNVDPPPFDDPADLEDKKRLQDLMQSFAMFLRSNPGQPGAAGYSAGFANFARERVRQIAAQYGNDDSHSTGAIEDAGMGLMELSDFNGAAAFMDQAIQRREHEGSSSTNYWRALKRRCALEIQQSTELQPPICEKALVVRSQQKEATPLELASWLRFLALTSTLANRQRFLRYQELAAGYYAQVPGISPAFMAAQYRGLAILALSLGDNSHAFKLNDLTNRYLARGDAAAQKAMVSSAALQDAGKPTPALQYGDAVSQALAKLPPQQQEQMKAAIASAQQQAAAKADALARDFAALNETDVTKLTPEQQKQRAELQRLQEQWKASGYAPSESPLLKGTDLSKLTPEQRQKLEQMSEAMSLQINAEASSRPQDAMISSFLALGKLRGTPLSPGQQPPGIAPLSCDKLSQFQSFPVDMMSLSFRQRSAGENLKTLASMGFGYTSIVQTWLSACTPHNDAGGPGEEKMPANTVPGYGVMVGFKGAFTESIAARTPTLMPGSSETRNQALMKLSGAEATMAEIEFEMIEPILPPQVRQELLKLPRQERLRAASEYSEQLQKNDPELAARLKQQMLQDPRVQKMIQDFKDPQQQQKLRQQVLNDPRIQSALADIQNLSQNKELVRSGNPLAFLGMLKPHEAYVDIYGYKLLQGADVGSERYMAVISDSRGPLGEIQLGSADTIDSAVHSFFDAVNGGGDLSPLWRDLQHAVMQPILDALPPDTEKIWLSPDSALTMVPFASLLLDMSPQRGIAIVPSPYDFVRIRAGKQLPPGDVLFVGDLVYGGNGSPLPYLKQAREEIDTLTQQAQAAHLRSLSLSGNTVTRMVVADHLSGAQFLHFSTHGFLTNPVLKVQPDTVLPGGIALSLANSGKAETLLNADDIRHFDLSTVELVTLSACETGSGTPIEGQGLLGFQTAFMAAGTRSVLFSLWRAPANQATTKLMQVFYEGIWKNHLPKGEALRQAQVAVRSDPRFADPRNWATWVLVGEAW
jgi:CHAT domain-containing protein